MEQQQQQHPNVYILFGPDFAGKHTYYKRKLSKSHVAVRPTDIYQKNPTYGFRDVCFQIVALLKEGWNVAIVDKNECKKTRTSYVKLLQKKCGQISFGAISVLPRYGCDQLFWTRELRLAEESLKYSDHPTSNVSVCDSQIQKWFMGESNTDISYQPGIVEALSENEGFKITENVVGICTRSTFKFEVPALFIQWELFCKHSNFPGLLKTCQVWADTNKAGRIIIICDGYQIFTGESKRHMEQMEVDEVMKKFTNQFTSIPVYVFHISEPKIAGSYIIPPKPGILAFLQQRHCLNLHSKRTLYLYDSTVHMKMAEAASVRHIKGSIVMENPELVRTSPAASSSVIQDMLQTMKLLSQRLDNDVASLPLYKQSLFSDGRRQQQLAHGRSEYLYSCDEQVLERYSSLYKELASKVGEPGSKFSPNKPIMSSTTSNRSSGNISVNVPCKSSRESTSKDLPKWMLKQEHKKPSTSLERSSSSDSSIQPKIRKTVYVMTDKELLEVACEVLKQGGKTDIVNFNKKGDETIKYRRSEFHPHQTKVHDKVSNIRNGNKKAKLCPKIELEFEDCDSVESELAENASSDFNVETDEKSVEGLKVEESNGKVKIEEDTQVEEVVAHVLDGPSSTHVTPKRSPRKRVREEQEQFPQVSSYKLRSLHSNNGGDKINSELLATEQEKASSRTLYPGKRTHHYEDSPDMSHLEDIF